MKISQPRKKPILLITIAIVVIIIVAYVFVAHAVRLWPFGTSSANGDYAKPGLTQKTIDDNKEAFAQKEQDAATDTKENAGNSQPQSATSTASVVVTDAAQYGSSVEVRSYIPDNYEDGTCTITFTKGSKTVSKQTPAYRDATTTICTNPLFSRSDFSESGTWSVTVVYASPGASGKSDARDVVIQ